MTDISVIGLGDMGSALASTLLENGYSVTVWNRSAEVFKWASANAENSLVVRQEWFYQPDALNEWMQKFCNLISVDFSSAPQDKILGTLRHPTSADFEIDRQDFAKSAIEDKQKYFRSKVDRWKQWTDEQRQQFEELCADNMKSMGYEIPWLGQP